MTTQNVTYKYQEVNGLNIFYRQAGDPLKHTLVLLHGFPTSSHMYREVLRELSDEYHLIAPDYPGFGNSDFPSPDSFQYTFDNLANVIDLFLESLNISSYTLMIQDYGAPIGYRIATAHPERIKALIVQNGNAYEEGLSEGFAESRKFWQNRTLETEMPMKAMFTLESIQWQYTFGAKNPETISPDNWNLDYAKLSRPGNERMQLDLLYDYQNNIKRYAQWQKYLRDNLPPVLITWGTNDPFFPEPGAKAYLRDVPDAAIYLYETGHFALEEASQQIIENIRTFMQKILVTA
ncbi:Pimeloyl-ACP methyl ester carboxylesterase [Dyadobacter koreensis]|uniref:Pimeloyl-ACP methyl ester carboxylesterase n=1 Tax=Dyadobacter koreensis TaxID=408657 RepID=A0A1H6YNT1_9BACT|nr:alpha/beta hydrolase [Dyadobacter koreensis]SEJ38930.1 Pimeloyl-ACP methyl ester carboxylesterase [Dyadobacter koreensis]